MKIETNIDWQILSTTVLFMAIAYIGNSPWPLVTWLLGCILITLIPLEWHLKLAGMK